MEGFNQHIAVVITHFAARVLNKFNKNVLSCKNKPNKLSLMIQKIHISEFLLLSKGKVIFDVRSPAEFYKGHIPNAINLPLFMDEERALVGTIYNKKGRDAALLEGLERVGPRLRKMVETVLSQTKEKTVFLHCWRGGMRSGSVAWLISYFGLDVFLLDGGYQSFRRMMLEETAKKRNFIVIGGKTGSGKTHLLGKLKEEGCQVLDLEGLAHHKGSAFGSIGMQEQPRQEHFENLLGFSLYEMDHNTPVILEDESRKIGGLQIPDGLFLQMREAPLIFLEVEDNERITNLLDDYSTDKKDELIFSVQKIKDNIGGQMMKDAITFLNENQLDRCAKLLLTYYDKTYSFGVSQRKPNTIFPAAFSKHNPNSTNEIITLIQNIKD